VQDWTPQFQQAYQQACWHRVEADNGAVYVIDLGSIQKFVSGNPSAIANIIAPDKSMTWWLGCDGHFSEILGGVRMGGRIVGGSFGPRTYAPPRRRQIAPAKLLGAIAGNPVSGPCQRLAHS
jgi:hypothetical protein